MQFAERTPIQHDVLQLAAYLSLCHLLPMEHPRQVK